jgi:hypothetical protein
VKTARHKQGEFKCDGFAMPLAILAMILLLVTGGALLALGFQSRAYQVRTSSDIAARCAADAGLTKALYVINQQLQAGSLDDDNLPGETDVALGTSDSSFSYQISRQIDGTYLVQASGTSNRAQRTEQAVLTVSNPLDFAVLTVDGINMHNSSVVDWYNYTAEDSPMKVGTNSTDSGAVDLLNCVTINGDVAIGAGGNPDEVVSTHSGTVITGDVYAQTQSAALPSVSVPAYLEQMSSGGEINNNATLASSGKYDAIDLGNSKTLTVTGNVELYITGDLTLGNSAAIEVDDSFPDSSLTIYLAGNLDSKNSSSVNNTTEIPYNCRIYGLDTCTKMDFKNSVDLHAVIYAPQADVVFHNSVDVYGAVIGKSLDFKNSSRLYYDASLRQASNQMTSLIVHRWKE